MGAQVFWVQGERFPACPLQTDTASVQLYYYCTLVSEEPLLQVFDSLQSHTETSTQNPGATISIPHSPLIPRSLFLAARNHTHRAAGNAWATAKGARPKSSKKRRRNTLRFENPHDAYSENSGQWNSFTQTTVTRHPSFFFAVLLYPYVLVSTAMPTSPFPIGLSGDTIRRSSP